MLNKIGKKLGHKEGGFTIIEVMIVLAVAGLIMAIVLIAIPQLQRSQRDSARQDVVNRVLVEMGNYAGNNNGKYPISDLSNFTSVYLADVDIDNPGTGVPYTLDIKTADNQDPDNENQMSIHPSATCDGEDPLGTTTNTASRTLVLRINLERSGIFYCVDNN